MHMHWLLLGIIGIVGCRTGQSVHDGVPVCQPGGDYSVVRECQQDCLEAADERGMLWTPQAIDAQCQAHCTVTAWVHSKKQMNREVARLSARVAVTGKVVTVRTPGGPQGASGIGLQLESGDKLWLLGCHGSDSLQMGQRVIAIGQPVDHTSVQLRWRPVVGRHVLRGDQIGVQECLFVEPRESSGH